MPLFVCIPISLFVAPSISLYIRSQQYSKKTSNAFNTLVNKKDLTLQQFSISNLFQKLKDDSSYKIHEFQNMVKNIGEAKYIRDKLKLNKKFIKKVI